MTKSERYKKAYKDLTNKIEETYSGKKLTIPSYIRLGLLAKYCKSLQAIYWLEQKGYAEDARIILRTLFEIFVTLVYCEENSEERYKRFFDYNVFIRAKYIEENYDAIKEIFKLSLKELDVKKEEFRDKYHSNREKYHWNDLSVKKLCEELDSLYKTEKYTCLYLTVYMKYSDYIHPNVVNVFENYIKIEDKKLKVNAKSNADEEYTELIEVIEEMNEELIDRVF